VVDGDIPIFNPEGKLRAMGSIAKRVAQKTDHLRTQE